MVTLKFLLQNFGAFFCKHTSKSVSAYKKCTLLVNLFVSTCIKSKKKISLFYKVLMNGN